METPDWRDMLPELLSHIAESLELVELLGFRSVCKNWKTASLTASAVVGSSRTQPWFLIYGGIDSQCFLLSDTGKKYTLRIPEMDGATCIASNEGWLLLSREDLLFFFCPFSKAIINLPKSPLSEFSDCAAAFSFVPTSPNCMVAVIKRNGDNDLELYLISMGSQEWTIHKFNCPLNQLNKITGALYHGGYFQFLDSDKGLLTFCAITGEWKLYTIVPPESQSNTTERMEFSRSRNRFSLGGMREKLGLEDKVSISTCGTVVIPKPDRKHDLLIQNETIEAADGQNVSHHLKGVWLQPRYYQISPQQSW